MYSINCQEVLRALGSECDITEILHYWISSGSYVQLLYNQGTRLYLTNLYFLKKRLFLLKNVGLVDIRNVLLW